MAPPQLLKCAVAIKFFLTIKITFTQRSLAYLGYLQQLYSPSVWLALQFQKHTTRRPLTPTLHTPSCMTEAKALRGPTFNWPCKIHIITRLTTVEVPILSSLIWQEKPSTPGGMNCVREEGCHIHLLHFSSSYERQCHDLNYPVRRVIYITIFLLWFEELILFYFGHFFSC